GHHNDHHGRLEGQWLPDLLVGRSDAARLYCRGPGGHDRGRNRLRTDHRFLSNIESGQRQLDERASEAKGAHAEPHGYDHLPITHVRITAWPYCEEAAAMTVSACPRGR